MLCSFEIRKLNVKIFVWPGLRHPNNIHVSGAYLNRSLPCERLNWIHPNGKTPCVLTDCLCNRIWKSTLCIWMHFSSCGWHSCGCSTIFLQKKPSSSLQMDTGKALGYCAPNPSAFEAIVCLQVPFRRNGKDVGSLCHVRFPNDWLFRSIFL